MIWGEIRYKNVQHTRWSVALSFGSKRSSISSFPQSLTIGGR